jgi:hypothetical protein
MGSDSVLLTAPINRKERKVSQRELPLRNFAISSAVFAVKKSCMERQGEDSKQRGINIILHKLNYAQ